MSDAERRAGREWWRETTVYQIYPRSFQDSNGDGIGDLDGVRARLDHVAELGIETIWLSPFFASPQADFGYDISDYRSVAPEYGTMETVDALIREVHERDMRIVLDMVLNHTSDRHPWFLASRSGRDDPKRDWYVWRDGRKPGGAAPPNNWRSMLGRPGWHHDPATDQWYWAQFLPCQPDLNYRNPEVREAMLGHMRFWLERGVDGFRLDLVNAIFEDAGFRDNPFVWRLFPSHDDPTMAFRSYERTLNHPDTIEFMKVLRDVVDGYDPPRFLVGEVNAPLDLVRAHCGERADGLNLVFLFESLVVPLEARALRTLMERYEGAFGDPLLPTWVFANHDRMRRISRLGDDLERAKANALLQMTARGVPFVYYGEEIGMVQQHLPIRDSLDPVAMPFAWVPQPAVELVRRAIHESPNRDECRTPMQWDASPHAGFCPEAATPWLAAGPRALDRTVEAQRGDPASLLSTYERLLAARRASVALRRGDLTLLPESETGSTVLGYRRAAATDDGGALERVTVLLNTSASEARLRHPAPDARFVVGTRPAEPRRDGAALVLAPHEGAVFVDGSG